MEGSKNDIYSDSKKSSLSRFFSSLPLSSHTKTTSPAPMPSLLVTKTKQWGKYDKQKLHTLVLEGKVDIEDKLYDNIDDAQERWFPDQQKRNFRRNFKDFALAFDLESALAGARRQGKTRV